LILLYTKCIAPLLRCFFGFDFTSVLWFASLWLFASFRQSTISRVGRFGSASATDCARRRRRRRRRRAQSVALALPKRPTRDRSETSALPKKSRRSKLSLQVYFNFLHFKKSKCHIIKHFIDFLMPFNKTKIYTNSLISLKHWLNYIKPVLLKYF
jgi:hypothetical protein